MLHYTIAGRCSSIVDSHHHHHHHQQQLSSPRVLTISNTSIINLHVRHDDREGDDDVRGDCNGDDDGDDDITEKSGT